MCGKRWVLFCVQSNLQLWQSKIFRVPSWRDSGLFGWFVDFDDLLDRSIERTNERTIESATKKRMIE
jgi:hypothetical protein